MIGHGPHVTISRRDWNHELARCGVCGSGVRLEIAEATVFAIRNAPS